MPVCKDALSAGHIINDNNDVTLSKPAHRVTLVLHVNPVQQARILQVSPVQPVYPAPLERTAPLLQPVPSWRARTARYTFSPSITPASPVLHSQPPHRGKTRPPIVSRSRATTPPRVARASRARPAPSASKGACARPRVHPAPSRLSGAPRV